MKRYKILVVDAEEATSFGLLKVLYQENEKYDILLAKSAMIGRQILFENWIDVMVLDVSIFETTSTDLLRWATENYPHTQSIVTTSFDLATVRNSVMRLGCVEVVKKTRDVDRLAELVKLVASRKELFKGHLSLFSVIDLVQMICLSQKTTVLRILTGEDCGIVHIKKGEVTHAIWNDLVGEKALLSIFTTTDGTFEKLPFPPDEQKTIDRGWQQLMMESMRIVDEQKAVGAMSTKNTDLQQTERYESDYANLIEQGFSALRSGDLLTARKFWDQAKKIKSGNSST